VKSGPRYSARRTRTHRQCLVMQGERREPRVAGEVGLFEEYASRISGIRSIGESAAGSVAGAGSDEAYGRGSSMDCGI
jgi:hypothetical protein